MAKVYVYKDFLANVINIIGMFLFIGGVIALTQKDFVMGAALLILGVALIKLAEVRARRGKSRFKARTVGLLLLVLQVIVFVEKAVKGTLAETFAFAGAGSLLTLLFAFLPVIFAVPLLLKPVRDKPGTVAVMLLVLQVIILVFTWQILPASFAVSTVFGVITAVTELLPAIGALILLLRSKKMSAVEKALFI